MQRGTRKAKHVPKEEEATGWRGGRDWEERRRLGGEEDAIGRRGGGGWEERSKSVPRSREGIRDRTCCGIDSRKIPRSLAAVGEVKRFEREKLLVRGNGI